MRDGATVLFGIERRALLALSAILLLGFGVRFLYLVHATSLPRYKWDDPDSYMEKGLELARGGDGFRWDFDVVRHSVEGRHYALPPLYPTFLSVFALLPGYPFNAQVGQVVLGTFAIALAFALGRQVHSDRAGLIAAAVSAAWLPNIIAVWSTMQEAVYVPLVLLAFVLLLKGVMNESRTLAFVVVGLVFGLATLTRSMPSYYMPFAALLVWNMRRITGLALGFAAVTVPYSIALSLHLGEPTFVENHGGIRVVERYGGAEGETPPGLVTTGAALVGAFLASPAEVIDNWRRTARSVLHVNGGRLLQIYLGTTTRVGAVISKLFVHVLSDFFLVASLLLMPFGFSLCRRPRLASFLVVWVLLTLALTVVSGFGGPRLRAPFEPHVIVLASVPLAGSYRSIHPLGLLAALVVSISLAFVLFPQLPASLKARADYGVHWPLDPLPKRSAMTGEAGFNVLAVDGTVEFAARPRNATGRTRVEVMLLGEPTDRVVIAEREHRFRYEWPRVELVHVELRASDVETGSPVRMLVLVRKR